MIKSTFGLKINIFILLCLVFNLSVCLAVTSEGSFFTLKEITPELKTESIIDTKATQNLNFKILDSSKEIYLNNNKITSNNNTFSLDISNLSGVQNFKFSDENGSNIQFTYYLSTQDGKLDGYEMVKGKDLTSYVYTYNNIKIIYTDKEKNLLNDLCNLINDLPKEMLQNISQIQLVPYKNTSNIAGTTKEDRIILYKFGNYDLKTQKNIIYHEITHTFANKLMKDNIIDENYTEYRKVVSKDKNYVTKYSKDFALNNNGKLSEDFAEGFAFYFIDKESFKEAFPNRYIYINSLLKNEN